MKTAIFALLLTLSSASAFADVITPPARCAQPDEVTYCGVPGTSKAFGWDSRELLEAAAANAADFAALTAEGRFIAEAKVEILRSRNSENFSNITQFTIISSERGSFLGTRRPLKRYKLVLRSYFDKRIMDDTPTIWESSGVKRIR